MKKFFKIICIIFISFLILCIALSFADKGLFYRIWYFGDRITIDISVEINHQMMYIDKNDVERNGCVKVNEEDGIISIPARLYGSYQINFNIYSIPITLELYQFNRWDVQDIVLYISIDTEDKMIAYYVEHTYLSEEALKETIYYSGELSLDESYNPICLYR